MATALTGDKNEHIRDNAAPESKNMYILVLSKKSIIKIGFQWKVEYRNFNGDDRRHGRTCIRYGFTGKQNEHIRINSAPKSKNMSKIALSSKSTIKIGFLSKLEYPNFNVHHHMRGWAELASAFTGNKNEYIRRNSAPESKNMSKIALSSKSIIKIGIL